MSSNVRKVLAAVVVGVLLLVLLRTEVLRRGVPPAEILLGHPVEAASMLHGAQAALSVRAPETAAEAIPAPPSTPTACHKSYHDFFVDVLVRTAGTAIAHAVYDPNIFNTWSTQAAGGRWDYEDKYWYTGGLDRAPVEPTHFANLSGILWWNKRLMSVALSRVSRDSELSNLYLRSCRLGPLNVRTFERSLQRTVEAQFHYFHTVLQLAIDLLPAPLKQTLHTLSARKDLYGVDPLVLLSGWVSHTTTIADIEALLEVDARALLTATLVGQAQSYANPKDRVVGLQPFFPIFYTDPAYSKSDPRDGKFWNMIRPTASCSSIVRLCEIADGCRFICNAEYLLYAGTPRAAAPTQGSNSTFRHRIVGMGCNNEYDWELSLMRLFDGVRAAQGTHHPHRIGWLAAMDCTLSVGKSKRQFNVPMALRAADIGFVAMSLCVDGKAAGAHQTTQREIKSLMVTLSQEWMDGNVAERMMLFTASKAARDAAKAHPGREHLQWMTPVVAGAPSVRYFDGLTFLKLDVEGYEHNVVPTWFRDEMRSIGATVGTAVAPDVTTPIDFEVAAGDYFSVSMFSLEFHRMGHRHRRGSSEQGALRAHWLLLHTYALGYVMVAHEKNEADQCCFEHAWVNTRHFIRSEMWMALREDL